MLLQNRVPGAHEERRTRTRWRLPESNEYLGERREVIPGYYVVMTARRRVRMSDWPDEQRMEGADSA